MSAPMKIFGAGLVKLHTSEEFSDCKIICGPYHFNVHKVVLASQSEYFKTAFKKGTFKEGETGTIELKSTPDDVEQASETDDACDDPEIVKLMIDYFYHFDYLCGHDATHDTQVPPQGDQSAGISWYGDATAKVSTPAKRRKKIGGRRKSIPTEPKDTEETAESIAPELPVERIFMIEHAKIFAMAVKYQVDGLRDLAIAKFKSSVTTHWDHEDFAHSVFIVHNSTAEDVTQLCDIVADALHGHFEQLQDKAEIETVVCGLPRLTYALLKRSRETDPSRACQHKTHSEIMLSEWYCGSCDLPMKSCSNCFDESNGYGPGAVRCQKCGIYCTRVEAN